MVARAYLKLRPLMVCSDKDRYEEQTPCEIFLLRTLSIPKKIKKCSEQIFVILGYNSRV